MGWIDASGSRASTASALPRRHRARDVWKFLPHPTLDGFVVPRLHGELASERKKARVLEWVPFVAETIESKCASGLAHSARPGAALRHLGAPREAVARGERRKVPEVEVVHGRRAERGG